MSSTLCDPLYAAFFDELEKIAYGVTEHSLLIQQASRAGLPRASFQTREALLSGTVGTDMGLSFPLIPWSDPEHAFPNLTRKVIHKNIQRKFDVGVTDVAKGILIDSPTRVHKGLKDIGSAHHTLMDYEAHFRKPTEVKSKTPVLRESYKKIGPIAGGWLSLVEHLRTGYDLDKLKPKKWLADQRAVQKSMEFGAQIKPAIVNKLVDFGMDENEATRQVDKTILEHDVRWSENLHSDVIRGLEYLAKQWHRLKE